MDSRFRGLFPAVHTPFRADGTLAPEVVELQAEWFLRTGVAGVFVAGTTGECHSLSVEERMVMARRWVDVASGTALKVIVHVGHNCQPNAIEMACQAGQIGADAVAVMPPNYFRPETTDDLLDFCQPIAAAAPETPFYYYDIPGMTGVHFPSAEVLDRGSRRIESLAGVKFSNTDIRQLQACVELQGGRFNVLFGSDEALLAGLSLGADGAIGSTYNFAAPIYQELLAAFQRNDLQRCRAAQARSVKLVETLVRYGFFAASKWIMSLVGVNCGPTRAPLRNLTAEAAESLQRELLDGGLLPTILSPDDTPVAS